MTTLNRRHNIANHIAVMGGLIQASMALSILFLPVLGGCWLDADQMICGRQSYLQLGGNILGYTFLIAMLAVGVTTIVNSRGTNNRQMFFVRWVGTLLSFIVFIVAGFGFGIAFAPGALLLLVSALLTRRQANRI
jgi:hypothetical protein